MRKKPELSGDKTYTSADGICVHHTDGRVEHKQFYTRTWRDIDAISVVNWKSNWTVDLIYKDGKQAELVIDKGSTEDMVEVLTQCIKRQMESKQC